MPEQTKKTITDIVKKPSETPNYEKLYVEECAKNKALENKVAEYEKLCKTYSERERKTVETLQRATLEYNARTQYMLDCARHAFMSMQFAMNATDNKQGGNQ